MQLWLYNSFTPHNFKKMSKLKEVAITRKSQNCAIKKSELTFLLFYFIQWWKWASIQNKNNNMVSIKSISSNGNPNKILLKPRFWDINLKFGTSFKYFLLNIYCWNFCNRTVWWQEVKRDIERRMWSVKVREPGLEYKMPKSQQCYMLVRCPLGYRRRWTQLKLVKLYLFWFHFVMTCFDYTAVIVIGISPEIVQPKC